MDVDQMMDMTNEAITEMVRTISLREKPWDGYGGLVKICDDPVFKEHGIISVPIKTGDASEASDSIEVAKLSEKSLKSLEKNLIKSQERRKSSSENHNLENENLELSPMRPKSHNEKSLHQSSLVEKPSKHSSTSIKGSTTNRQGGVYSHKSMTPVIQDVSERRTRIEEFQVQLQNILIQDLNAEEKKMRCGVIADQAFKAAVERVQEEDYFEALQLIGVAENACPLDKVKAKEKINDFKLFALQNMHDK